MSQPEQHPPELLDVAASILLVIDVQDHFLQKLEAPVAARVVERIRWLVQVARWFEVPIVVTAEDLPELGPTTARIRDVLPEGAADLNKLVFGLAGQTDILRAVDSHGRGTAVLVGLETDVCVQQSAFGLARLGYSVAVVVDATASPDIGHQVGLDRMRARGIAMVSCKSLFYEWTRSVATTHRFTLSGGIERPRDLLL